MVLSGQVRTVAVGRKRLIDIDRLPEYLAAPAPQTMPPGGGVRRIAE